MGDHFDDEETHEDCADGHGSYAQWQAVATSLKKHGFRLK